MVILNTTKKTVLNIITHIYQIVTDYQNLTEKNIIMTITQRNIYEGIPAGLDDELIEIIAKNDNNLIFKNAEIEVK